MQPCPRQTYEATLESQKRHVSHWRKDGTCSYCGSISSDMFFAGVEQGCKITPTDKGYKVYIDLPEPNADELVVVGAAASEQKPGENWEPADLPALRANGWTGDDYKWMCRRPKGQVFHAKFYFQHLTEEEKDKFIELYNAKKMKMAYPGYLYVRPYFCAPTGELKNVPE